MTNNKYFQNLEAISALNALEDEAAATCSGGADLELYEDANFGGQRRDINVGQVSYLGFFNDKTSSIKINSGTWEFYNDADFNKNLPGLPITRLGPGEYSGVSEAGIKNDELSSVRRIG
jgi:hypothetical protein